ncbi:MAG TPA: enoyl-CoA hydratase/isomerase family protein [Thermoleophilaceae bacterium]
MTVTVYEDIVDAARADTRELVRVERDGDHAIVRMDDPESLNALSAPLTLQLHDALAALAADRAIRSIVLTGSDPAFSAGGDLRLMQDAHEGIDEGDQGATLAWRWIRYQFGGIARLITRTDKAFIAAVNGAAAGVGLAFALACDIVIASERARIVPAFMKIGLLPEVGTSWHLTRRIGYQRTFELFAGGRILSAQEADDLGMVNAVVPHDALMDAALEWCKRISQLPPHALAMTKPLLRNAADMPWEGAITMEELAEPNCFTTTAHRGAVQALLAH